MSLDGFVNTARWRWLIFRVDASIWWETLKLRLRR